ncbi:MAG: hypothetical protein QOG53_2560 [Frankiales bacterium]|jgi:hypothetical protein|nr:hypothetical protein [Frankiales bacterium]
MKRLVLPLAIVFAALGFVSAQPHAVAATGTIQGRAVDSITGAGVGGVKVSARDVVHRNVVLARATTSPGGYFTLSHVTQEEVAVLFNGSPVSYETGWLSCGKTVVPTWGEACSAGWGAYGKIKIDHT